MSALTRRAGLSKLAGSTLLVSDSFTAAGSTALNGIATDVGGLIWSANRIYKSGGKAFADGASVSTIENAFVNAGVVDCRVRQIISNVVSPCRMLLHGGASASTNNLIDSTMLALQAASGYAYWYDTGGAGTFIGSSPAWTLNVGDTVDISMVGTTTVVKINGVTVWTFTDPLGIAGRTRHGLCAPNINTDWGPFSIYAS